MDGNKICFIICVNNEQYEEECIRFLGNLNVPEGMSLDLICIKEAKSMVSGYNEGMNASDAKYKIYLHQDVFLIDPFLINKILKIFEDAQVGMIGLVGATVMPENQVMWYGPRIGKIFTSNIYYYQQSDFDDPIAPFQEVEAIDGLFIATQYDLSWREDLLDRWDFYDVSQSYEFRKQGYKVVVPYMEEPWCIHDDGFMNLLNYYEERKKMIREYPKDFLK